MNISSFILNDGSADIEGAVSVNGNTVKLAPSSSLDYSTTYSAILSKDIIDLAGNNMEFDYTWYFTTVSSPFPEIKVKQGTDNIICGTGNFDFGPVGVSGSSAPVVFTVQNAGTLDLIISGVSLTTGDIDQFDLDTAGMSYTLSGGESTAFSVTFAPASAGIKTAVVEIVNNDSDEGSFTFSVTGEGSNLPVAQMDCPPSLTNSPDIDITISGVNVVAYKYKLDGYPWSGELDLSEHIIETLSSGAHILQVKGKDSLGNWQVTPTQCSWTVDCNAPTAWSITPLNNSKIKNTISIAIRFNETIDTATLSLTGTMASDGKTAIWSKTNYDNDTLTISPTSTWTAGESRTLTVDCKDLAGNSLSTLNLTYHISDGIFYVKTTGDDSSLLATQANPRKTIQSAINLAQSIFASAEVRVAQGTYTEAVTLSNGISLYGGYSASDWGVRNPAVYTTTINNTTNSGVGVFATTTEIYFDGFTVNGFSDGNPANFVITNSGHTIIQNNTLNGTNNTNCSVIYGGGIGSKIKNNIINLNSGARGIWQVLSGTGDVEINANEISSSTNSEGILYYIYSSTSKISIINNKILAGLTGIRSLVSSSLNNSNSIIRNNTIKVDGSTTAYGIELTDSAKVQNNSISANSTNYSVGIVIYKGVYPPVNPIIENNIVFTVGGTTRLGIWEWGSSTDPSAVNNNDIFDCSTALYYDVTGYYKGVNASGNFTINADGTGATLSSPVASGNKSVNPQFVNLSGGDWHLTASTPSSVKTGGLNLSAYFTTDKDGVTRTAPWSMGAYEKD